MKPRHLVIVQDRETQFDAPLYRKIAKEKPFELTVFYTGQSRFDEETGRQAVWDHLSDGEYARVNYDAPGNTRLFVSDIANLEPDLVIISGYAPASHRKLVRPLQRLGCRVGLRSDNTLRHSSLGGVKGWFKQLYLRRWLSRYDSWHPVGSLAREYLENIAANKRPVFLFPYNVDVDWFAEESANHARLVELRHEYGIQEDDLVVLGIVKWHEREDPLTLVRAFEQALEKQPNMKLTLVGDGPLKQAVMQASTPISQACIFPGFVPYSRLPHWYGLADIFVHPAVHESWGVSMQEAIASEVPVIMTENVGSGFDLLKPFDAGRFFPEGDHAALAGHIQQLAESPELRSEMSGRASQSLADWCYEQSIASLQIAMECPHE